MAAEEPLVLPKAVAPAAIDSEHALAIAEAVYATNPIRMRIYWPSGWSDYDDFEPSRLMPALEAKDATDRKWSGSEQFLVIVKAGKAHEFIAERRRFGIAALTRQIVERDERAPQEVRAAGFKVG